MANEIVELLTAYRIPLAVSGALVFLIALKPLLWWLFSFDSRVSTILHQKKSSEVRTGKVAETMAPLLEGFPVDVKKPGTSTVFLGQPIDFIHFDPSEGVTLIEVKSGSARLTPSQERIKRLVEEGKVRWETFRVDGAAEEAPPKLRIRRRR
ncbi:MAG: hypothetical protein RL417_333 [Pseudomonadota bacterium]|jgi:hypothetical protein